MALKKGLRVDISGGWQPVHLSAKRVAPKIWVRSELGPDNGVQRRGGVILNPFIPFPKP